jgi:hypothetical protein
VTAGAGQKRHVLLHYPCSVARKRRDPRSGHRRDDRCQTPGMRSACEGRAGDDPVLDRRRVSEMRR